MQKRLVIVCLINFLIAALMGMALRYTFIQPIGLNYRFLTHAHSHVAMLGWLYLMLYVLIIHFFVPEKRPIYNRLFWLTQFAVIGMMLSFPFQGYAAISISFSTLHIFCSYYFAYLIWKHHKTESAATKLLLKTSLIFMLLSTIGVWCLGPAVSMLGQASAFYQIAIQFFLHFQFNGWFIIGVVAIFFHLLQLQDSKRFGVFFNLLVTSTILTLALPVYWFIENNSLLWINGTGVIIQLAALFHFLQLIKPKLPLVLKQHSKLVVHVYSFAIFCFVLKILLQLLSLLPNISEVIYQHRNFIIGFIHLTMLGIVSGFIFSFILQSKLVNRNSSLTFAIYTFISGFVLTELLLMVQGGMFYYGKGLILNYYPLLFLFSALLPIGITSLLFNIIKNKTHGQKTLETS
ncbi:hypothetical protein [Snuella lapsa]|uniref:hypothetical protein n=1 Tax=Snuella lapsa TaxID=870481 RepID=UPI0031F199AC